MRPRLIAAVLERIARSPIRDALILRGSVLTAAWLARATPPEARPARDLDFVGQLAFSVPDVRDYFAAAMALPVADGIAIGGCGAEPMWTHTPFPGIRLTLALGLDRATDQMSIDIGYNDPLVPPPTESELAGTTGAITLRAVRPETQLAWKLHALAELGANWRPKDLADAWRICAVVPLDDDALVPALVAAFASRGYTRAQATGVLVQPHWATKTSRVRWTRPEPLAGVLAELQDRLEPRFAALPEEWPWP